MKAIDIDVIDLTELPTRGRPDALLLGIGMLLSIAIHVTVVAALICVLTWSMQEIVAQPVLLTLNTGASVPTKPDSPSVEQPSRRRIRTKNLSTTRPMSPVERPIPVSTPTAVPVETVLPATNNQKSAGKVDDLGQQQAAGADSFGKPPGFESEQRMARTYLDGHFSYLRELILKRLAYPPEAKRRGYVGRVTVSFVILVSGKVTELAVISGSGYRILDENVLQTIRSLGTLPKPPVKVQIVLPISYSLD